MNRFHALAAAALVLATGLSGRADEGNAEQEKAYVALKSIGAKAGPSIDSAGKPIFALFLKGSQVTDGGLEPIKHLTEI